MIKKTKNPLRFSFKLVWVMLAVSMVVYACSGPIKKDNISSEIESVTSVDPNFSNDSILVTSYFEPDNGLVKFVISIGKDRITKLSLFDKNNTLISDFMDGNYSRGLYTIIWKPENNEVIPPGTYSYVFTADDNKIDGIFLEVMDPLSTVNNIEYEVFTVVEVMPEYPGGMDELGIFLSNNIKYPIKALKDGVEGRVFVNFVVGKDGSVIDSKVIRGIGSGCDEEAIRVIDSMPNWIPGKQRGQAVNVSYNLPIRFALDEKEKDTIFKVVEVMPVFPGGEKKLMSYLGNNIKYPEKAKKDGVKGRVFITFVVEKDGRIDNVELLRGIGSGCDEEAMRVIKSMPKWSPGMTNGEPVRVQYNLPIKFALQ